MNLKYFNMKGWAQLSAFIISNDEITVSKLYNNIIEIFIQK